MGFHLDGKIRQKITQDRLDMSAGYRSGETRTVIALPEGQVRADRLAALRRQGAVMPPYRAVDGGDAA